LPPLQIPQRAHTHALAGKRCCALCCLLCARALIQDLLQARGSTGRVHV
jgi:hypothetical protein